MTFLANTLGVTAVQEEVEIGYARGFLLACQRLKIVPTTGLSSLAFTFAVFHSLFCTVDGYEVSPSSIDRFQYSYAYKWEPRYHESLLCSADKHFHDFSTPWRKLEWLQ